ncbi:LysE family translocator [Marinomonas sp. GJ51-6]|uniref:LysE family translocator n=1 Tax=Marinomonas sp. GJ51-6 TaxID=2992802 RepID=UPI002934AA88|nr:LysE family transporter [Marinomonas sp. GJ51-6]WOD07695.1 LysE family transporter [Marinomonas sp. GJ51-6]
MLANSGANFGVRKTLPHVLGIRIGMTVLHIAVLLGLGQIFKHWPILHDVFTVVAAAYIIYMSAKIAFAKPHDTKNNLQPMSTKEAALFQAINPKSWSMLITASSVFTLTGDLFWPSAIMCLIAFNTATLLWNLYVDHHRKTGF